MSDRTKLMELRGVNNLKDMLNTFSDNAQRRIVGGGLRKAGARLRTYMRRRVPVGETGDLRRAIGLKGKRAAKFGWVRIGLTKDYYYRVLDIGRKPYKTKRGQRAGTPTFKSRGLGIGETYEAHKQEIAQMIVDEMKINIFKEWGKMAGRALRSN